MMNYSIVEEARELAGWSKESEALSIYQALETIEDICSDQGKRYGLALLLTCVLLGKMAGETTLQAIAEWIRFRSTWLQEVLPQTRATFPCAATYSNVLRGVDPAHVNQILMDLLTRVRAQKREAAEQEHVVLDGKTLRGTQQHLAADQRKMHPLNLYEAKTGFSPIASVPQNRELQSQSALGSDKRLLHYTYSATHTSAAPILCLTFDPTGKELLYGAQTDGIHRVDTTTLRLISTVKTCTKAVTSLALNSDGKYAGSGRDDGTLILWHLAQWSRYKTLQAHSDWVSCVDFSANGRYLLSSSDDGSLRILEIATRSSQVIKKATGIRTLTCHPQQELSASCSLGQRPIVWQIAPDSNSDPLELAEPANCLHFNPTGHYLAAGNTEGALVIYDTQSWSTISLPAQHSKAIHCLAFHPAGTLMASGGDDQVIQLWDIAARKHIQTLPGHSDRITGLAFSPDGSFLVSAGRDAKLIVWKSL